MKRVMGEDKVKRLLLVGVALLLLVSGNTGCTASAGISWDRAKDHIGESITVYGPVVDTHYASDSKGQPTFLNIGKPYPDPGRFTVVIWGEDRANFASPPEVYYEGKIIFVTGLVTDYEGIPEIEVKTPAQIQEQ